MILILFFQNIQFCVKWINIALFHIFATFGAVKQEEGKSVTFFKVNIFHGFEVFVF